MKVVIVLMMLVGSVVHARVPNKPNRLTVLGGYGPDARVQTSRSDNETLVTHNKDLVVGLMYQRKFKRDMSVTGTILSNETMLLGLGKDF